MASHEYLIKYCRPQKVTETIEIEATIHGQVITCPHRTYRNDRYVRGHYMCSLAGGICDLIRNPIPVDSPVLKSELLERAKIFLTGKQIEIYVKEMEYPWHTTSDCITPTIRRGWMLGTEEPWSGWKEEAYELAKHLNDPNWQEKINIFLNKPGGPELLAHAKRKRDSEQHFIWIHPDGT